MKGGFSVKRYNSDEGSILNDFSDNINIVVNGQTTDQNKLLNELYYQNPNFNSRNIKADLPKRQHIIPDVSKPIEPGQIDPEEFFGSSLKGLF